MGEESIRENAVKAPEKEATALVKKLRHNKILKGLGISVYAYVNKKGIRALHVAADKPKDDGADWDRFDLHYKADTDLAVLDKNATKRICAHFGLT